MGFLTPLIPYPFPSLGDDPCHWQEKEQLLVGNEGPLCPLLRTFVAGLWVTLLFCSVVLGGGSYVLYSPFWSYHSTLC